MSAEVSLFSRMLAETAANTTHIDTYGETLLAFNLRLPREFHWIFILVDVEHLILGRTFQAY